MELCICGHHKSCHKNGAGPCVHCRKVFARKLCADGRELLAQNDGCASYRPADFGPDDEWDTGESE